MDWKNTTFGQNGDSVPDSCCILDAEDCGKGILNLPDEVTFSISFDYPYKQKNREDF